MRKVSFSAAFGMASEPAKGRRRMSASVEPLENRRLFSIAYAVFDNPGGNSENVLVEFDTADPATIIRTVPVFSPRITGLDFDPVSGGLYAVTAATSTARVQVIDPVTGRVIVTGASNVPQVGDPAGNGFDFDAGRDVVRITSVADRNVRYHPVELHAIDSDPTTFASDPDVALDEPGAEEAIASIAYDNNFSFGPGPRTLYGLDAQGDALVRIGGAGDSASADRGVVTTIGQLGVRFTAAGSGGFDIAQDGTAYAALADGDTGLTGLYAVNLSTGAATRVGNIGDGTRAVRGFAIEPENRAPLPKPDTYRIRPGETLDVPAPGILGNDTDSEGDPLTFEVTRQPQGSLTVRPDGSFTYDPGSFVGSTKFRYVVSDGASRSREVAVTINVQSDTLPTITVEDASFAEGNVVNRQRDFIVRLSEPNYSDGVSFLFTTSDGTAVAGEDYNARTVQVSIPPGVTVTTIDVDVTVRGDTVIEPDETFFVNLSNVQGATVVDGQAVGTILDDDPPATPTLSISDLAVLEGDDGATEFSFVLFQDGDIPEPVTVNYATAYGLNTDAEDLTAQSGTLTLSGRGGFSRVSILVNGDLELEGDEQFTVNLSDATNATIADGQAVGTIRNDDEPQPLGVSIDDVTRSEGNAGLTPFTFTVTRTSGDGTASVKYATEFTGNTSVQDMDHQSGTVTFAPGETARPVTIYVKGDHTVETDNLFYVTLSDATNATIEDGRGTGTILNDDTRTASTLNINNVTRNEGNSGKTAFTFTVTRSSGVGTASVKYATAYGFNASSQDFAPQSGTVSFAAGQTSRSVTIYVNGDTSKETDNTFFVNLSQAVNAVIGDGQGLGTIRNDD